MHYRSLYSCYTLLYIIIIIVFDEHDRLVLNDHLHVYVHVDSIFNNLMCACEDLIIICVLV